MKKLAIALIIFLVPTFLSAQVLSRPRIFSQLGTCAKDGEIKIITDAATAGVCAAGGTSLAACWCDLSTTSWISQPVASSTIDLSAYAALAGADFTGPVTITLADGEEVSVTIGDDLDSTWAVTGGDGFIARMNCDGGTCVFTIATSDLGNIITVDEDGVYMQSESNCILLNGLYQCGVGADAPYTCTASGTPGYYTDSTGPDLCYCDGTNGWVPVDGSGTCSTAI